MRTAVVIYDPNGGIFCELEKDGYYYKMPEKYREEFCTLMDIGDEWRIEAIEVED